MPGRLPVKYGTLCFCCCLGGLFSLVKAFDFGPGDDLYICTLFHFHELLFVDKTLLFSAGACENP